MLKEFKKQMWNDGPAKQPWLNYFNEYELQHCCFGGDGGDSDSGGGTGTDTGKDKSTGLTAADFENYEGIGGKGSHASMEAGLEADYGAPGLEGDKEQEEAAERSQKGMDDYEDVEGTGFGGGYAGDGSFDIGLGYNELSDLGYAETVDKGIQARDQQVADNMVEDASALGLDLNVTVDKDGNYTYSGADAVGAVLGAAGDFYSQFSPASIAIDAGRGFYDMLTGLPGVVADIGTDLRNEVADRFGVSPSEVTQEQVNAVTSDIGRDVGIGEFTPTDRPLGPEEYTMTGRPRGPEEYTMEGRPLGPEEYTMEGRPLGPEEYTMTGRPLGPEEYTMTGRPLGPEEYTMEGRPRGPEEYTMTGTMEDRPLGPEEYTMEVSPSMGQYGGAALDAYGPTAQVSQRAQLGGLGYDLRDAARSLKDIDFEALQKSTAKAAKAAKAAKSDSDRPLGPEEYTMTARPRGPEEYTMTGRPRGPEEYTMTGRPRGPEEYTMTARPRGPEEYTMTGRPLGPEEYTMSTGPASPGYGGAALDVGFMTDEALREGYAQEARDFANLGITPDIAFEEIQGDDPIIIPKKKEEEKEEPKSAMAQYFERLGVPSPYAPSTTQSASPYQAAVAAQPAGAPEDLFAKMARIRRQEALKTPKFNYTGFAPFSPNLYAAAYGISPEEARLRIPALPKLKQTIGLPDEDDEDETTEAYGGGGLRNLIRRQTGGPTFDPEQTARELQKLRIAQLGTTPQTAAERQALQKQKSFYRDDEGMVRDAQGNVVEDFGLPKGFPITTVDKPVLPINVQEPGDPLYEPLPIGDEPKTSIDDEMMPQIPTILQPQVLEVTNGPMIEQQPQPTGLQGLQQNMDQAYTSQLYGRPAMQQQSMGQNLQGFGMQSPAPFGTQQPFSSGFGLQYNPAMGIK